MDFFTHVFNRPSEKDSADVAKQRLQLVLAQDRTNISPEMLNALKDEMISVISRRIEIDRSNVQVSMTHTGTGDMLIANIPVMGVRAPARALLANSRSPSRRARRA